MPTSQFNPNVNDIIRWVNIVEETVGREWIDKELTKLSKKKSPKNLRKFSYLYQQQEHPLIALIQAFKVWSNKCLKTGQLVLSEKVLELCVLGQSIERSTSQKHFDRVRRRLRLRNEFESAAFEIEVAASYVARGWSVEFVEEGTHKSPDLEVTRNDGSKFWVECKRRDHVTKRDRKLATMWREVERDILAFIGPKRLNFAIAVYALQDPTHKDIKYLKQLILNEIGQDHTFQKGQLAIPAKAKIDASGKFEILIQPLSGPDEEFEANKFGFSAEKKFDKVTIGAEARHTDDGRTFLRNPIVTAFGTNDPPDRVKNVVDALKAARKQLPKSGPGVVWIRVPDNAWANDLDCTEMVIT